MFKGLIEILTDIIKTLKWELAQSVVKNITANPYLPSWIEIIIAVE